MGESWVGSSYMGTREVSLKVAVEPALEGDVFILVTERGWGASHSISLMQRLGGDSLLATGLS